jgi:hypothetical protein
MWLILALYLAAGAISGVGVIRWLLRSHHSSFEIGIFFIVWVFTWAMLIPLIVIAYIFVVVVEILGEILLGGKY